MKLQSSTTKCFGCSPRKMNYVIVHDTAGVGAGGKAAIVGVGVGQPFAVDVRSVSEFIIDYHLLKNKKNDRPKSPMSVETGKGQYSTR